MNKYTIIRKLLNIQYSNFIVVTKGSTHLFPGATHYNFGLNTVFGIDMDETSFWSKDDYRKLYVLIPETYENNIHITNTLSTNKEESEDSGILNNNLFNAFKLETTYTREQNLPITINYNKSRYHEYTFDYKVRSVGFVIE